MIARSAVKLGTHAEELLNTPAVQTRYGTGAQALHWLMFLLIAAMYFIGLSMVAMEVSPERLRYFSLHKYVAKFPTISFGAPSVQLVGEAPTRVPGTLTMLGVTRPLTLEVSRFRCMDHPFQKARELCGGDAAVTIKRSEWGMKHLIPAVGDDIRLDIQLEAVREK